MSSLSMSKLSLSLDKLQKNLTETGLDGSKGRYTMRDEYVKSVIGQLDKISKYICVYRHVKKTCTYRIMETL